MSPAADAGRPAGAAVADWSVVLIVFLGGFVMFEPAPVDLLLMAVVVAWAALGLRLNRHFMPLTVLLLLYCAGGVLALTQIADFSEGMRYAAISGFMAASAVFFAAVIVEAPARRAQLIRNAYIAAAVIVSAVGILAYFEAIPGAEMFTLYDRAKGTFKDPNVFGPFLVLPAVILARDILTRRLRDSLWEILWLLVILSAIFLSFSRAAWGMVVVCILIVAWLAYATEAARLARLRLVAYLAAGGVALALLVAAAISVPAVQQLYVQRAQVVQDYDLGRLGRFERQQLGFFLIQEKPLGIGAHQFGRLYGADEHSTWLKGFTVYGWLGGFAYIVLAAWTLAAAAPLLFKPRPWQALVQCTYAVFVGHLIIHAVIDANHWRHLFLIYGILWGAIAAEKMRRRAAAPSRSAPGPAAHAGAARPGAVPRAKPRPAAAVPRARPAMPAIAALRQG